MKVALTKVPYCRLCYRNDEIPQNEIQDYIINSEVFKFTSIDHGSHVREVILDTKWRFIHENIYWN